MLRSVPPEPQHELAAAGQRRPREFRMSMRWRPRIAGARRARPVTMRPPRSWHGISPVPAPVPVLRAARCDIYTYAALPAPLLAPPPAHHTHMFLSRLTDEVHHARSELDRLVKQAGGALPARPPATGASNSSRTSKPGAGKRPRSTPQESEREARQVTNAKKMMAYYVKEAEMLKRKLAKARTADEQLVKLEATLASTEAALSEAQKKVHAPAKEPERGSSKRTGRCTQCCTLCPVSYAHLDASAHRAAMCSRVRRSSSGYWRREGRRWIQGGSSPSCAKTFVSPKSACACARTQMRLTHSRLCSPRRGEALPTVLSCKRRYSAPLFCMPC